MDLENHLQSKKSFIFGFDNVLFPEKDYLLQVYYLFSEFIEYTEQKNAKAILEFMREEFTSHGSVNVFERTAKAFDIDEKYKSNFMLLHENARLPLKLLLYQNMLMLLQEVVVERKNIFLMVQGFSLMQLNKIRQTEWHGLEQYLKLYFSQELEPSFTAKSIDFIIEQHELERKEVLFIGNGDEEQSAALSAGVEYLSAIKLF
ncbi:MAG: haloacid dehalogenase [Pedobacter sp.]|nr:MAG: haloacid dehalogenase [Pedobacter sp.]